LALTPLPIHYGLDWGYPPMTGPIVPAIVFPSPSRTRTCRFSTWLNWPAQPQEWTERSIRSSLRWLGYLSPKHWTASNHTLHRLTTGRYCPGTFLSNCLHISHISSPSHHIVALLSRTRNCPPFFSPNLHCLTAKTRARPEAKGGESLNGRITERMSGQIGALA
jgi:hypothetical protein